LGTSTQTKK